MEALFSFHGIFLPQLTLFSKYLFLFNFTFNFIETKHALQVLRVTRENKKPEEV